MLRDGLDVLDLVQGLNLGCIEILRQVTYRGFEVLVPFVKEILLGARLSIIGGRDKKRIVIFEVAQCFEDFEEF